MRKDATYHVDVAINTFNTIAGCQCECTAGQGPDYHCKHVQVVLWALMNFGEKGELQTSQTCTDKLQTFHKAKKDCGSPVKMQDLNLGAKQNSQIFDPRPSKFVGCPGYNDSVRNLTINTHRIPIQQTFLPANQHAVAMDHDYLALSPVDQFLHDTCITSITSPSRTPCKSYMLSSSQQGMG